jgi:hypothetical protein
MTIRKLSVIHGEDDLDNVHVTLIMHSQALYRFKQDQLAHEENQRPSVVLLTNAYMRMSIHSGSNVDDRVAVELHFFSRSDHA